MTTKPKKSKIRKTSSKIMKSKRTKTIFISHKEDADGIWFYDTCNTSDQIEQKQSIGNSKTFSKQTR